MKTPVITLKTTMLRPHYLAQLALQEKLHTGGLLLDEMINMLNGTKNNIAMTFADGKPVCVSLYTNYGQLMTFTRRAYRRKGIAKRTSRLLARRIGVDFDDMAGGPGKRPGVSQRYFESLGVYFDA